MLLKLLRLFVTKLKWVPVTSMVLPHVRDEEMASKKENSCQYTRQVVADSRRRVTHLVLLEGLATSRRKNQNVMKHYTGT